MSKFKTNHVFGTENDDNWMIDFQLIDGVINPDGGNPIPLIEIPGDAADTMRIARAIRGNPYNDDAEELAMEFVQKRRRLVVDVDAASEK